MRRRFIFIPSLIVSFLGPIVLVLATGSARLSAAEVDSDGLQCSVDGDRVTLSWNIQFFAPIAGWVIARDGEEIVKLEPAASEYVDTDVPRGEHVYTLSAIGINADGTTQPPAPLARCAVTVGEFGLECRVDGRKVLLDWGPLLSGVAVRQFVIRRDGEVIGRVPGDVTSFVDTVPAPGTYRYVVTGEFELQTFPVGACTVRVDSGGLTCRVDPPVVLLDWSNAVLPAVVISHFVVVRDGQRVGATRETKFTDMPGPGEHHYVVLGLIGPVPLPDAEAVAAVVDRNFADVVPSKAFIVGECTIFMPGREVPPPEELTCVDLDAPPDVAAALDVLLEAHDVLLVWQKPVEYDRVVISRNDAVIATIEGSRFWYVDRDVPAGHHVYSVIGVVGNQSSPPAKCEVSIPRPPLPPPTDLVCEVLSAVDVAEGALVDSVVQLRWRNGGVYQWVVIVRNGERIARIPGNAMTFRDLNPSPGANRYEVFGVVGLLRSRSARCDVVVPPTRVPSPRNLRCVVISPVPPPGIPIDPVDPPDQIGGEDRPVDIQPNPDPGFAPPGVLLRWENPIEYDRIVIRRNGIVIATLPGTSQSYLDPFVSADTSGVRRYEVSGVVGNRASEPAVCEVKIDPPVLPPPRELTCEVGTLVLDPNEPDPAGNVPGDPVVAPVVVVTLSWVNPVRYARLLVSRDGQPLAELPGQAMVYRDTAPPAGVHVYSLRGVGFDGQESREVECRVEVPQIPVPPVRELTCVVTDTNAQGLTAVLEWKNAARYDGIVITRDGDVIAELRGGVESHFDTGLEPGVYEYSVIAFIGERRSRPVRCRVVVEGPGPKNILYFSSGLFQDEPPDGAPIALASNGRIASLASNRDPLQGWSFGICSDPSVLVVEDATIEGTEIAELNEGAGPTFLVIRRFEEGVIMAVVIDEMDPTDTLPPATDHRVLDLRYSGGPDAEPAGSYPVRYCDTLNEPPVSVLYVVEGFGVVPETRPGLVTLPVAIRPGFVRADANSDLEVEMSDSVFSLWHLFMGGPEPKCRDAADANGDGAYDIADPVYTLQWKFSGGPPPPAPFPGCGPAEFVLGCEEPTCP